MLKYFHCPCCYEKVAPPLPDRCEKLIALAERMMDEAPNDTWNPFESWADAGKLMDAARGKGMKLRLHGHAGVWNVCVDAEFSTGCTDSSGSAITTTRMMASWLDSSGPAAIAEAIWRAMEGERE